MIGYSYFKNIITKISDISGNRIIRFCILNAVSHVQIVIMIKAQWIIHIYFLCVLISNACIVIIVYEIINLGAKYVQK